MKSGLFAGWLLWMLWTCLPTSAVLSQSDDLNFTLELSPTISWLTQNSSNLEGAGSKVGFRFNLLGEKYFGANYSYFMGAGMSFGQGGGLRYKVGGNFLPNSTLSDPSLNDREADQPLPDDTKITYSISYVELMGGLRLYTQRLNLFKYLS